MQQVTAQVLTVVLVLGLQSLCLPVLPIHVYKQGTLQVDIDAQGLLKVVHMVKLQHSSEQDGFQAVSSYSESQASIMQSCLLNLCRWCMQ